MVFFVLLRSEILFKLESKELYTISFKGLSVGSHLFEWTLDKLFFDMYEMSEIGDASMKAQVRLVKHTHFLELHFEIDGWAEAECDRCLDPLKLDVSSKAKLFVKFGKQTDDDGSTGEDMIVLSYDEDRLNVAQYLYEYAHLNLPIRKVHADDENGQSLCNLEMIKKLEQFLVNN